MNAELIKQIIEWNKDPEHDFYIKPEKFDIVPVKGFKNGLKKRDGILLQNMVVNLECVKNLELKKDDAFVIGFPKSGMNSKRNRFLTEKLRLKKICLLLANSVLFIYNPCV